MLTLMYPIVIFHFSVERTDITVCCACCIIMCVLLYNLLHTVCFEIFSKD